LVSVNLSAREIVASTIGAGVADSLHESGFEPTNLVLEITEHDQIDDYPALREGLALLGPTIRVAVDDAGAGYASLRHILELAPSFVKLDIGLIRGIDTDSARQALIAGMGYFALKRKLRLIAEGIETPAELKTLIALGVAYGQGYLLGRPQDGGAGPGGSPDLPQPRPMDRRVSTSLVTGASARQRVRPSEKRCVDFASPIFSLTLPFTWSSLPDHCDERSPRNFPTSSLTLPSPWRTLPSTRS